MLEAVASPATTINTFFVCSTRVYGPALRRSSAERGHGSGDCEICNDQKETLDSYHWSDKPESGAYAGLKLFVEAVLAVLPPEPAPNRRPQACHQHGHLLLASQNLAKQFKENVLPLSGSAGSFACAPIVTVRLCRACGSTLSLFQLVSDPFISSHHAAIFLTLAHASFVSFYKRCASLIPCHSFKSNRDPWQDWIRCPHFFGEQPLPSSYTFYFGRDLRLPANTTMMKDYSNL